MRPTPESDPDEPMDENDNIDNNNAKQQHHSNKLDIEDDEDDDDDDENEEETKKRNETKEESKRSLKDWIQITFRSFNPGTIGDPFQAEFWVAHARGLVGKDLKAIAQIFPLIAHLLCEKGVLSVEIRDLWTSLGKYLSLVFVQEIPSMEEYQVRCL